MRWRHSVYATQPTSSVALRRQLPLIGEASGVSGKLHKGRCTAANLQVRHSLFFEHFLLLLQKKTLAKEKEPEGISISPQTPLNRPEKPLRFFWTFPAIAENPMRIRTTLWTFSAGYFAAVIQTQLLTNPLSRIRRRVAETRKVSLEWNAKLKSWFLPKFRGRKHQT